MKLLFQCATNAKTKGYLAASFFYIYIIVFYEKQNFGPGKRVLYTIYPRPTPVKHPQQAFKHFFNHTYFCAC